MASLIRLAIFDRFLCRVFMMPDCPFVLKGGTAMLARLPGARATTDIDFETREASLSESIPLLSRAAALDLADHFLFRYAGHRETGGPNQGDSPAVHVTFSVTVLGAGVQGDIKVDLALHDRMPAAPLELMIPDFRPELPRLGTVVAYRTIGIEDQIADKVCATMSDFGGQASSRSKDLVDLAIITRTLRIDAAQLRVSVVAETSRRGIPAFTRIAVPQTMAEGYSRLARSVPLLADALDAEKATEEVNTMLVQCLSGGASNSVWDPALQRWTEKTPNP